MALSLCGVQEGPSLTPSLLLADGLKLMAVAQPSKYFLCFPADSSQLLSRWFLPVFGHWLGDAQMGHMQGILAVCEMGSALGDSGCIFQPQIPG